MPDVLHNYDTYYVYLCLDQAISYLTFLSHFQSLSLYLSLSLFCVH